MKSEDLMTALAGLAATPAGRPAIHGEGATFSWAGHVFELVRIVEARPVAVWPEIALLS
jgi:hypothetical protein